MKAVAFFAVGATALVHPSPADHDAARQQIVDAHNANPENTWTMGIPDRFRGQAMGASSSLLGVMENNYEDVRQKIADGLIEVVEAPEGFAAPDTFDSETAFPECAKVISDIRDQSNCGCCWAFGGASAASDRLCIATKGKVQVPISANDVCFGASWNGCGGGQLYTAWNYLKKGAVSGGNQDDTGPLGGGFCQQFSMPHCHHHGPQDDDPYPAEGDAGCPSQSSPKHSTACDSGAASPHDTFAKDKYSFNGKISSYRDEAAIQSAIMAGGPVETAFTVYKDFENYDGGVYQKTSWQSLGGHAVRMVGWGVDNGTKYWKVANSWNPYWGEEGYFRILRGSNHCGIEGQAMSSSGSVVWNTPSY